MNPEAAPKTLSTLLHAALRYAPHRNSTRVFRGASAPSPPLYARPRRAALHNSTRHNGWLSGQHPQGHVRTARHNATLRITAPRNAVSFGVLCTTPRRVSSRSRAPQCTSTQLNSTPRPDYPQGHFGARQRYAPLCIAALLDTPHLNACPLGCSVTTPRLLSSHLAAALRTSSLRPTAPRRSTQRPPS